MFWDRLKLQSKLKHKFSLGGFRMKSIIVASAMFALIAITAHAQTIRGQLDLQTGQFCALEDSGDGPTPAPTNCIAISSLGAQMAASRDEVMDNQELKADENSCEKCSRNSIRPDLYCKRQCDKKSQ